MADHRSIDGDDVLIQRKRLHSCLSVLHVGAQKDVAFDDRLLAVRGALP